MIWSELVRLALLGGERSTLSPELRKKLESYGIQTDNAFPEVLLESAALVNQIRKAAFKLEPFEGQLPDTLTAAQGQACSARSTAHLYAILAGRYAPALTEFLQHLEENKKAIPQETLPDLLNASLEEAELWHLIQPVLGKQGEWLLKQWPAWQPLLGIRTIGEWQKTTLQDRIGYLKFLRQENPQKAIEVLGTHWNALKADEKFKFLKILEVNLSDTDEVFLEHLLSERSKKIRMEAARLLAGIDKSQLIERLFLTLLDIVHISENTINFELPETLPETTLRDGIMPVPRKETGGGLKAAWLYQMVSKIPPRRWSELLDKDASECLPFFLKNRWSDQLLPALTEAALLHRDPDWMNTVLEHLMIQGNNDMLSVSLIKKVIGQLPAENISALANYGTEVLPRIIDNKSLFFLLLTNNKNAWTDRVSIWVLQNFKEWMRTQSKGYFNLDHYREIITAGAYAINPQLGEKFKIGWPASTTIWYYWEDAIDKMIRTLAFRKDMIKNLRQ
jgi:hypothetical protein